MESKLILRLSTLIYNKKTVIKSHFSIHYLIETIRFKFQSRDTNFSNFFPVERPHCFWYFAILQQCSLANPPTPHTLTFNPRYKLANVLRFIMHLLLYLFLGIQVTRGAATIYHSRPRPFVITYLEIDFF